MSNVLFCTDRVLAISRWDKAIAKLTGRAAAEAVGKRYYEVLPRMVVDDSDAVSLSIKRGSPLTVEGYVLPHASPGSGPRCADLRISPRVSDGSVCGARVTFHNVSRVGLQSPGDKDNGAPPVLHGMRNSLNTLKGALTILQDKYASEGPLTEFLGIMDEEVNRLAGLISQLRRPTACPSTDVNAVVKRLEVFSKQGSTIPGIPCAYEYADIPPVALDAFTVEQLILNVINGAKASGAATSLFIRTKRGGSRQSPLVVIEICDSAQAAKRPRGTGGYDFSFVRDMLRLHGGRLAVRFRPGTGTTIRFCLPVTNT